MSTITGYAFDSLARTGGKRPGFIDKICLVAEAMREGHVAARRYRELTALGVAHDKAAAQVFAELYRAA